MTLRGKLLGTLLLGLIGWALIGIGRDLIVLVSR